MPAVGAAVHATWDYGETESNTTARNTLRAVLDKVSDAGVGWVRIDFSWATLEYLGKGDRQVWYQTRIENALQDAHARGLKVLAILSCTPWWAAGYASAGASDGAACKEKSLNTKDFSDFAQWAAATYSGALTPAGSRIDAWELWNEPDLGQFWEPNHAATQRPVDYVNSVLIPGYEGLKLGSGAANVPVLLGAPSSNSAKMVPGPVPGVRVPSTDPRFWLNAVYRAGALGHFDVMATHPYMQVQNAANLEPEYPGDPNWTDLSMLNTSEVRELMAYHGDAAKRLWFTEFGWSSHANACLGAPGCTTENWNLGVSAEQQADYLIRAMELVLAHPEWAVDAMFVYSERNKDTSGDANTVRHQNNFGLLERIQFPSAQVGKLAYRAVDRYLAPCTITVLAPALTTYGTPGPDVICGTDGPDIIQGGGGGDVIRGYAGNDHLYGQGGNDDVWGGPGDDTIVGGNDSDNLYGGEGADMLDALDGAGGDALSGGWQPAGNIDDCISTDTGDTVWSCP